MTKLLNKKIFWLIAFSTFVLFVVSIGIFVESVSQKRLAFSSESMTSEFKQIDPDYGKNIGVLPYSKLYGLKIWQENLIPKFLSGNLKNKFIVNVNKKRVVELAFILSENQHQNVINIIKNYNKNLESLDFKRIEQSSNDLIKVYLLISAVRSNTSLFPELDEMATKTYEVVSPFIQKDENIISQDFISGKVVLKNDLNMVIEVKGQNYNVRNINNAEFVDANLNRTSQTVDDIQVSDQVKIIPIAKQVYLPTDGVYGNLSADRIVVENEN